MKTIRIEIPAGLEDISERHFGTIEVEDVVFLWLQNSIDKTANGIFQFYPVHYDKNTMTAYLTPEPSQPATKKTISFNMCQHAFQPVFCTEHKLPAEVKKIVEDTLNTSQRISALKVAHEIIQTFIGMACTKCGEFKKESPNE